MMNNKVGIMGAMLAAASALAGNAPKGHAQMAGLAHLPRPMQGFRAPNQRQRRRDARRRGEPVAR